MKALLAPVFAFALILCATPVPAQTPNPSPAAPAATTGRTSAGATFSLPSGWTERNVSSAVIVLDAPENDAHLAIVDITKAADARAACRPIVAASLWNWVSLSPKELVNWSQLLGG